MVGRKICGNYEKGWYNGKIEYFNTKLKEYFVLFDDGSSDYIEKDDIDGVDIILLDDAVVTKRKSGGKVSHVSKKRRIVKLTPKILKQNDKKCRKSKRKVKSKVSKDKYPAILKVVKKRGRKKTALKGQCSNQKELVEGTFKGPSEVLGLVWLFKKHGIMSSDSRTLGLQACPDRLDIQHPSDDMFLDTFEEIVDVSGDLSDPKRLLFTKEARKPQCLDLLLDRRLQLKIEEEGRIEKYWWTARVYSKTDVSGKILLKSTEIMDNSKVIKAKNDFKKLARRPCKNVPKGLINASSAQILPPKPVVQGPELLVVNYVDSQAKATRDTGKSLSEALLFAEHGENLMCTKIVLNVRNNFCAQHVLPRFQLGIFMY